MKLKEALSFLPFIPQPWGCCSEGFGSRWICWYAHFSASKDWSASTFEPGLVACLCSELGHLFKILVHESLSSLYQIAKKIHGLQRNFTLLLNKGKMGTIS